MFEDLANIFRDGILDPYSDSPKIVGKCENNNLDINVIETFCEKYKHKKVFTNIPFYQESLDFEIDFVLNRTILRKSLRYSIQSKKFTLKR